MKEKSNFLKFAYEKNKVKELEKAFEEYPVEEEEHKGNKENLCLVAEESASYNLYKIGDIVFVKKYKYQDASEGQNHLFVIVENYNYAIPIEYFGMLISSKIEKIKFKENKLIKADRTNNLKKNSIIKTDVIYKIADENILFKIGEVDIEKIEEYKKNFIEVNR